MITFLVIVLYRVVMPYDAKKWLTLGIVTGGVVLPGSGWFGNVAGSSGLALSRMKCCTLLFSAADGLPSTFGGSKDDLDPALAAAPSLLSFFGSDADPTPGSCDCIKLPPWAVVMQSVSD
jgi:hypothetical protein